MVRIFRILHEEKLPPLFGLEIHHNFAKKNTGEKIGIQHLVGLHYKRGGSQSTPGYSGVEVPGILTNLHICHES